MDFTSHNERNQLHILCSVNVKYKTTGMSLMEYAVLASHFTGVTGWVLIFSTSYYFNFIFIAHTRARMVLMFIVFISIGSCYWLFTFRQVSSLVVLEVCL